jgi:hypothetical protein
MNYTFEIPDGSWMPIIFTVIICLVLVAWIKTLIEIVNHEYSGHHKIVWLGLVAVMPLIGMVLYYAIGRNHIIGNRGQSDTWIYREDEFV